MEIRFVIEPHQLENPEVRNAIKKLRELTSSSLPQPESPQSQQQSEPGSPKRTSSHLQGLIEGSQFISLLSKSLSGNSGISPDQVAKASENLQKLFTSTTLSEITSKHIEDCLAGINSPIVDLAISLLKNKIPSLRTPTPTPDADERRKRRSERHTVEKCKIYNSKDGAYCIVKHNCDKTFNGYSVQNSHPLEFCEIIIKEDGSFGYIPKIPEFVDNQVVDDICKIMSEDVYCSEELIEKISQSYNIPDKFLDEIYLMFEEARVKASIEHCKNKPRSNPTPQPNDDLKKFLGVIDRGIKLQEQIKDRIPQLVLLFSDIIEEVSTDPNKEKIMNK